MTDEIKKWKIEWLLVRILIYIGILAAFAMILTPNFIAYRKPGTHSDARYSPPSLPYTSARSFEGDDRVGFILAQGRDAGGAMNTEEYDRIRENGFLRVLDHPLSTFSIDVDTASYSNVRRFIQGGRMPPVDAVRIEEMINYFTYSYPQPDGGDPFAVITEISECPWNRRHRLVHIGLQGKRLEIHETEGSNLVFLIDTSGSMSPRNKLPLLIQSLELLLEGLGPQDRVAIVTYAGSAGLVLPSTPADGRGKYRMRSALDRLRAGGTTAGGAGIDLAYRVADQHFIPEGNNRVILATDGDFNVGISSTAALVRLIEKKREAGIYLTICGLGMGNLKDGRMEQISNAGNGNYFYIDTIREAKKVFGTEMRANLFTIAKDVKIQIEFNPVEVSAYRLVGYENRLLAPEDFRDDTKDAGELGAGHTVTALYEIIPAGADDDEIPGVGPLRYQAGRIPSDAAGAEDILLVKLRYKPPESRTSKLMEIPVEDRRVSLDQTSDNFRFSAAVAGFGMLLRQSAYRGDLTYADVMDLARGSLGAEPDDLREELVFLVERCARMSG